MAEEGQVIACHAVDSWKQPLQRGKDTKKLVVIDFTASWCGPCRLISPTLAGFATTFRDVIFLKVDVDELQAVAEEWEVEAMPTFVFLKGGTTLEKFSGANIERLQVAVLKYRNAPVTATASASLQEATAVMAWPGHFDLSILSIYLTT